MTKFTDSELRTRVTAAWAAVLITVTVLMPVGRVNGEERPPLKWAADKAHSTIEFRTSHWAIIDIVGWFIDFDVRVLADRDDFTDAIIAVRLNPDSVQMPNMDMASNVKAMFDTSTHPFVEFRSTSVRLLNKNNYEILGKLTMKGITKEIALHGTHNGFALRPNGIPGFTFQIKLNRLDFGLGDGEEVRSDKMIGHEVIVTCNIRLDYASWTSLEDWSDPK